MRMRILWSAMACVSVASAATCSTEAVAALGVARVSVTQVVVVPAEGRYPEFCRVSGTVTTTGEGAPDGSARFNLLLPAEWSGKFLFYGVGGLAGGLPPNPDSEGGLAKGYAVAVTDSGHQAGGTDARWAITAPGKPDQAKIIDYYYRAAHDVTVATKAIVLRYYGADAIQRAYFAGCSNGGRMALQEAQRFPDDYDGIVAGAPFMSIRALTTPLKVLATKSNASFVGPDLLNLVDRAVYASCDAADGVEDGLIQNPGKCSFNPDDLVCKMSGAPNCLTKEQAQTLKRYLEPVRDSRGAIVTPGFSVSDIAGRGGAAAWTFGSAAPDVTNPELWTVGAPQGWLFANHIVQYFVKHDPNFHSLDFGVNPNGTIADAALKLFDEKTSAGNADDPARLRPFVQKNKKLLLWHGWSDPALTPFRTVLYYEKLADLTPGGYSSVEKNVRLFMVPGMQHCGGGPGPGTFNSLAAMENWVEKGIAPEQIPASNATRSMPLCKFPQQAHYKGSGDVKDAANWSCVVSPSQLDVGPNGMGAGLGARR